METEREEFFINDETAQPGEPALDDPGRAPDIDQQIRRAADRVRTWVFDHPFAALGIAVAAGFVVGRAVRR